MKMGKNYEGIAKRIIKGSFDLQVPIEFQLSLLGLNESCLTDMVGKRVLDIGCGNGGLVECLRERGIEAEGIDRDAPEKEYFMRQFVSSVSPGEGCIPRRDNCYDLVLAFQLPPLNKAFTYFGALKRASFVTDEREALLDDRMMKFAAAILFESLRVVKNSGKIIVYPDCQLLDSFLSSLPEEVQGYCKCQHEAVKREMVNKYVDWENDLMNISVSDREKKEFLDATGWYKRTILKKAGVLRDEGIII